MPKTKVQCPECSTYTITFTPQNTFLIRNFIAENLKKGVRVGVERAVNKLVGEGYIKYDNKNEA